MNLPNEFDSDQDTEELLQAITELQQNVKENIQRSDRFAAECGVAVTSGNISDRDEEPSIGVCHDVSADGCRVVLDAPLTVGDIFLVQFDKRTLNMDPAFSRCVRCIMLREDKFECGFSFFSPVSIPSRSNTTEELL